MGLLASLKAGAIAEVRRWVTVRPFVNANMPELRMLLAFLEQAKLDELAKKTRNRNVDLYADPQFRRDFHASVFRGIEGVTRDNLRRVCEAVLLDRGLYGSLPEGEITLDKTDEEWLFRELSQPVFTQLVNEALSLDDFARQALEQEKKDSAPTSGSA